MSEGFPKPPTPIEKEPTKKEKIIALAIELSESHEVFPFPGIDPEAYAKLKADITADADRSDYDISLPTLDEVVEHLGTQGMKVVLWKNRKGEYTGDVAIMPKQSTDRDDSILPKHLQITEKMDERLKELILLVRS
ncbi:MAG: hypothetical protein ACYCZZ_01485 [Minisyncoccota bacterium]